MVFIRQIHEFDLPALFTPQVDNIKVSVDHQILVTHRKGASIFALQSDPSGPDLVVKRSVLSIPTEIEPVSFGPNSSDILLADAGKDEIFELLKNRILTPRSYEGLEFHNYFLKAAWSLTPIALESTDLSFPRCIIAALTSNFQLILYGQIGPNPIWQEVGQISQVLNQYLIPEWESRNDSESGESAPSISFAEYKSRLYQASIVDFTWIEADENNQLLTAQADGSLTIWKIAPPNDIEPVFTSSKLLPNQIISTMKYASISSTSNEAILGIGTNSGSFMIYTITKYPNLSINPSGLQIWEPDLLQVTFIHISPADPSVYSAKSTNIDILFAKHSNYICTTRISYCGSESTETVISEIRTQKIPHGHIVGMDVYDQGLLMISHANGMLSLVQFQNGQLDYEADCSHSLVGATGSDSTNRSYNGWALSRNKSLAFIGKHLNCYFDHNLEKYPAKLVVFSTIPENYIEIWKSVESIVAGEESRSLDFFASIRDVLVAFRYRLRTRKDPELYRNLENLPTTLQFLRLRLWILRCVHPPKDLEELTKRRNEAEEKILQKLFMTMEDSALNSNPMITAYLKTVGLPVKEENTSPSTCIICGEPMFFIPESMTDPPSSVPRWKDQTCSNGHRLPISVFSLLPCGFQAFRTCEGCGVVGEIDDPQGNEPFCPLCGEFMPVSKKILGTQVEGSDSFEDDSEEIHFIDTTTENA